MWQTWWATVRAFYQIYRKVFWWLVACSVIGIIMAIVSINLGGIGSEDINQALLDQNLLNMATVGSNLGGFLWQRWLSILLPCGLALLAAMLSPVTGVLAWLISGVHGYWLCMTGWWAWCYYQLNGLLLLAFYLVWWVIVSLVLWVSLLMALRLGQLWRENCRKKAFWQEFWRFFALISGICLLLGAMEFLVFRVIIGRIVYKPR